MTQSLRNVLLAGAFAGFALAGSACNTGYGEPCELPDAQQVALSCTPVSGGSFCVYERAHDCDSNLCASYQGRPAICTEHCADDSDCAEGSSCKFPNEASANGFCLPDELISAPAPTK